MHVKYKTGVVTEECVNGLSAFQLVQSMVKKALGADAAAGKPHADAHATDMRMFDVILMDQVMPLMNGVEATKRIRALNCQVPIIALTGSCRTHTLARVTFLWRTLLHSDEKLGFE